MQSATFTSPDIRSIENSEVKKAAIVAEYLDALCQSLPIGTKCKLYRGPFFIYFTKNRKLLELQGGSIVMEGVVTAPEGSTQEQVEAAMNIIKSAEAQAAMNVLQELLPGMELKVSVSNCSNFLDFTFGVLS